MNRYENPAVVIGGTENGLGMTRNLGRNGIDVYCVLDHRDAAAYSKYCKEYFVFPGVTHDLRKLKTFLDRFKNLIACKAVLFPFSDASTLNLSCLTAEANDHYLFTIPDRYVLDTLIKKSLFYRSLSKNNVPHPRTLFPDLEGLRNIDEIAFPVFVKPSESYMFSRKFGEKGFVAYSEEELHRYLRLTKKHGLDMIVQEIVPGPAKNHYIIEGYFDKNSKPVILFARQRLRMFPPSFGNSSSCLSIPISEVPDMKEILVKYLSSLNFRGIFCAEFKVDPRDSIGKLLEINARSWGGGSVSNTFSSVCGANIILTAYLDAIGEEVDTTEDYETGILGMHFFLDFMSCLSTIFAQRRFSLQEWPLFAKGEKHWSIWARDDTKPFAFYVLDFLRALLVGRNWYINQFKKYIRHSSLQDISILN